MARAARAARAMVLATKRAMAGKRTMARAARATATAMRMVGDKKGDGKGGKGNGNGNESFWQQREQW